MKKTDYRLELFCSIFLYKSFMKTPDYRLEQSGAALKHFPLQILYERGQITDWSCSEAPSLTNPLSISQITDWSWSEALSLANPWRKALKWLITGWSWSALLSLTNPVRQAMKKVDYTLELFSSTVPYKSFTKRFVSWVCVRVAVPCSLQFALLMKICTRTWPCVLDRELGR